MGEYIPLELHFYATAVVSRKGVTRIGGIGEIDKFWHIDAPAAVFIRCERHVACHSHI